MLTNTSQLNVTPTGAVSGDFSQLFDWAGPAVLAVRRSGSIESHDGAKLAAELAEPPPPELPPSRRGGDVSGDVIVIDGAEPPPSGSGVKGDAIVIDCASDGAEQPPSVGDVINVTDDGVGDDVGLTLIVRVRPLNLSNLYDLAQTTGWGSGVW